MSGLSNTHANRNRRRFWKRAVLLALVSLVLAAIVSGGWMVYWGATFALQAEENLHATLFTIRLVEQFVSEHGRWPASWKELEETSMSDAAPSPMHGDITVVRIGGQHGYEWPAASPQIQQCVSVDFAANLAVIVQQNPMRFSAIKPIGPYYEYRHYGFVDSLQSTIRSSVNGIDAPELFGDNKC